LQQSRFWVLHAQLVSIALKQAHCFSLMQEQGQSAPTEEHTQHLKQKHAHAFWQQPVGHCQSQHRQAPSKSTQKSELHRTLSPQKHLLQPQALQQH